MSHLLATSFYGEMKCQNAKQEHTNMDGMIQKNRQKFVDLKKLDLPVEQYAITGSVSLRQACVKICLKL
jgi:hypothetical protein